MQNEKEPKNIDRLSKNRTADTICEENLVNSIDIVGKKDLGNGKG